MASYWYVPGGIKTRTLKEAERAAAKSSAAAALMSKRGSFELKQYSGGRVVDAVTCTLRVKKTRDPLARRKRRVIVDCD